MKNILGLLILLFLGLLICKEDKHTCTFHLKMEISVNISTSPVTCSYSCQTKSTKIA